MKKQKQQTAPEVSTDADGQRLVHVALANTHQRATLYAEDFQRLKDAGFSLYWSLNDNGTGSAYVKANGVRPNGRRTKLRIARMLAEASHGEHVRFADGNALNLRLDNLRIQKGRARYSSGELLPNATAVATMHRQGWAGGLTGISRVHAVRPELVPQVTAATSVVSPRMSALDELAREQGQICGANFRP